MTQSDYQEFLQFITPQISGFSETGKQLLSLSATDEKIASEIHIYRKNFIQNYLNRNNIDCPVIQLEGKDHIYVKFPVSQYNPMFKIKTIIAHYDIFPGSPGANDNSAAVFAILQFAVRLSRLNGPHNVRIIFTDGEELGEGGISEQGAFSLAQLFKKLGITKDEIYVFDCMGRGNIPIICENKLPQKIPAVLRNGITTLENKAEKILKAATGGKWFRLPTSYSDNASFISNGIPAIAITMLPSEEVDAFLRFKTIPETWKRFHTMEDSENNITPVSFDIFACILNQLAIEKTLLDFS